MAPARTDEGVRLPDDGREASEPIARLLRDLRTSTAGLAEREAARRLVVYGPNALARQAGPGSWRELAAQLTHPLALLLWVAAALAAVAGTPVLAGAIVGVIVLNAVFAFAQERQAERAVEALGSYLPHEATVVRAGRVHPVDAATLVPGDVVVVEEGDRVSADARLVDGAVEVDLSALTGESAPVERTPTPCPAGLPHLQATDLVFSGTLCTSGSAHAVVLATGSRTELGRIAALSQRVRRDPSPLEVQVKRVAWLIAAVALAVGLAFLPLGLVAGLPLRDAAIFAVGLLVANVPEGLLPTITLALAVGVRVLARRGAVVKRLSAVETLGSTTVICTDKTGTLTQNRMRAVAVWTPAAGTLGTQPQPTPATAALADALLACTTAARADDGTLVGDATEVALVRAGEALGGRFDPAGRDRARRATYRFDPVRRLMSTADDDGSGGIVLHAKGAPEDVLGRCVAVTTDDGGEAAYADGTPAAIAAALDRFAAEGLRVLAVARRRLAAVPASRDDAEQELTLLGVVGLLDPPRPHVAAAVRSCHAAGLRVLVVTGDHALTAAHVAREVGIGGATPRAVHGDALDRMSDDALDALLAGDEELVFARSSPEAKLRIADSLRAHGQVVAMTGDGVNDAPALRRADIGVAMGRTGTEVAREAATMVLTDDDFATIVTAIEEGRRVYDNVRKFILYIFAHAVPEVVPFLVFALSGGAVPLPLTVLQILAIDLGTETLPALALGREPAEPGVMSRPPRPRSQGVITPSLLVRAWAFLGVVSAALVMLGFFVVLGRAGWHPGDPVGAGTPLHAAYLQATTATFVGIVACQVGTALAARTERAALRGVGLFSNPMLLWGIGFELAFAAALVYLPPLQQVFGTAALSPATLAVIAPFPVVVWGADELNRWRLRRRPARPPVRPAGPRAG